MTKKCIFTNRYTNETYEKDLDTHTLITFMKHDDDCSVWDVGACNCCAVHDNKNWQKAALYLEQLDENWICIVEK